MGVLLLFERGATWNEKKEELGLKEEREPAGAGRATAGGSGGGELMRTRQDVWRCHDKIYYCVLTANLMKIKVEDRTPPS